MQSNPFFYYSCNQENSGLHHPRGAPVNFADSIDITSMSTYANAPVNLTEWSSAVPPIIRNSDRPLTSPPRAAEIFGRVGRASCHQTALGRGSPSPLASCDYFTDARLRPWWPAVQPSTAHAYVPQMEGRVTLMQPDGSHVPPVTTDRDTFTESWSHGGDPHHAVAALAQPASLRDADHPPNPLPASLYTATSPDVTVSSIATQTHMTGSSGVSSWMANAVIGHVPSSAKPRRYSRRPYARLERVACDKCKKPMRRQSLKRHIREVHDHIKRGHTQSSLPAGPQ